MKDWITFESAEVNIHRNELVSLIHEYPDVLNGVEGSNLIDALGGLNDRELIDAYNEIKRDEKVFDCIKEDVLSNTTIADLMSSLCYDDIIDLYKSIMAETNAGDFIREDMLSGMSPAFLFTRALTLREDDRMPRKMLINQLRFIIENDADIKGIIKEAAQSNTIKFRLKNALDSLKNLALSIMPRTKKA